MKRRFLATLILYFLLPALAFADLSGRVTKVSDGDTVSVLDGTTQHKVRLTGIDAPERGQPYGNQSRKHLAALIAGQFVTVESTKSDRYGRILGKVIFNDTDVNLEQVEMFMFLSLNILATSSTKLFFQRL